MEDILLMEEAAASESIVNIQANSKGTHCLTFVYRLCFT
jgi:hypothetical protein